MIPDATRCCRSSAVAIVSPCCSTLVCGTLWGKLRGPEAPRHSSFSQGQHVSMRYAPHLAQHIAWQLRALRGTALRTGLTRIRAYRRASA